jgi:ATP-dependent DNA helicase DinG
MVFDEAHNLEGAATRHLSARVWPGRFYRILNRLHKLRTRRRGGRRRSPEEGPGTGLLPSISEQIGRARGKAAEGFLDRLKAEADQSSSQVGLAVDRLATFSAALSGLWAASRYRDKIRYAGDDRRADLWEAVLGAKQQLVAALSSLLSRVERIADSLIEDPDAGKMPRSEELGRDLTAVVDQLRSLVEDIDFTVKAEDPRYVYWAELGGRQSDQPELWAAPLEVAPMLAEQVYGRKRSCVLCSATMTVAGRFDYLTSRLGLDREAEGRVETLLLGTPFDYRRQVCALIPGWLPEPGNAQSGRNSAELAAMLRGLMSSTRGRGLVLFTSYGALDEVYSELKPRLEAEGISVLGQGRDGSREALLAALQEEKSSVLLATSSFWEGVDVRGPALSCLVIARLPFQVYTEPLFKARAELVESRGQSSFMNYSVPEAVLRFRQGFGRLIRSRADRGLAVLADRRLISKRYGPVFLASLPCSSRVVSSGDGLIRAAEEFFGL